MRVMVLMAVAMATGCGSDEVAEHPCNEDGVVVREAPDLEPFSVVSCNDTMCEPAQWAHADGMLTMECGEEGTRVFAQVTARAEDRQVFDCSLPDTDPREEDEERPPVVLDASAKLGEFFTVLACIEDSCAVAQWWVDDGGLRADCGVTDDFTTAFDRFEWYRLRSGDAPPIRNIECPDFPEDIEAPVLTALCDETTCQPWHWYSEDGVLTESNCEAWIHDDLVLWEL